MKQKAVSMLLVAALAASVLAGCGNGAKSAGKDAKPPAGDRAEDGKAQTGAEESGSAEESTDAAGENGQEDGADISQLTFGHGNWKIDMSYDYSGPQYKRFDGLEFTRVVDTGGNDLPEGQTIDDNDRVWNFQLRTGLSPKTLWSASGEAYTQKLNAAIASGEIPDLMMVDMNQYFALVKSGLIADLTEELLEEDHPGIQGLYEMGGNVALEALKVDGRIYGIPKVYMNFDGSPLVWIRQDWMEALNLEEPRTYADLERIAEAFMEADFDGNGKKDTYGIPILASFDASYGGDGNLCDMFLNVGGAAPGIWQKQDDSTVIYGSLMEGAKDTLTMLNDWYRKGIVPSDFATWDSDTIKQIIGEDKAGIALSPWFGCWGTLDTNINLNREARWAAYMLPGAEGEEIRSAAGNPILNVFVVRKDFKDPSVFVYAYDMLVTGYKPDPATGFSESYETSNAYTPMTASTPPAVLTSPMRDVMEKIFTTHEIRTQKELEAYVAQETDGIMTGTEAQFTMMITYGLPVDEAVEAGEKLREVFVGEEDPAVTYGWYLAPKEGIRAIAYSEPTAVSTVFQGTTASMAKYGSFLETFEQEAYTKMIMGDMGGKTVSEYFDEFVEQYLNQGGREITEEVQELVGN